MSEERQEPGTGENQRDEVKQLREAIARLETIASQLAQKPETTLPNSALQVLSASVDGLSTALAAPESYQEMEIREVSTAESARVTEVVSSERLPQGSDSNTNGDLLEKLQDAWEWVLEKVRDLLPESVEENLSDGVLTGILGGFIAAIAIGAIAFSGGEKSATVAQVPEVTPPAIEQPVQPEKQPQQPIPELPDDLAAPTPPKPISPPKSKPFSLPFTQPKLTPEQNLIAAIQEQVAEITDRYANGLISSIQANFFSGALTVTVSPEWYVLEQPQQNELANEVLGRSRQLDFTKIEILDEKGAMVARSPVVGSEMVIFKRTQPEIVL